MMKSTNFSHKITSLQSLFIIRKTIFLALFVMLQFAALANWSHTNQSYHGGLNKIKMVNSSIGYAVGGEMILKTTDGGANWTGLSVQYPKAINQSYAGLLDLSFVSATEGYVVGFTSTIFKTMDGGQTWLQLSINNSNANINCIQFINSQIGYIGDENGKLFKTENGGLSWTAQNTAISSSISSISFVDANTGWFAGASGVIKKTTDGGSTWTSQTSGTTNTISSLFFLSSSNGWFTTSTSVVKTTNGGSNWSVVNANQEYANQIFFTDANTGWLVSLVNQTTIQKTTNGGTTWTSQYSGPVNDRFVSVYFLSSSVGYAAGYTMGQIHKTTNGGTTWTVVNDDNTPNNNYAVSFVSTTADGWMVGAAGSVLKTTNNGLTWASQTSGTTALLTGVYALSSSVAWFTGLTGVIRKTTDGGANWTTQYSGFSGTLYDIEFFDANNGLCVGDQGKILRTTNGGNTWTAVTSNSSNALRNIIYTSSSIVYIVGHGGEILKSTNSGSTWTALTSGTTNNLIGSYFISSTEGFACGAGGTMLKTTNGTTWTAQSTPTSKYFTKMLFTNATNGWAVGQDGLITRSTDGGKNWVLTKTFTTSIVNSIALVKTGDIVAACQTGMIGIYKESCPPAAPTSYNNSFNQSICVNTKTTLFAAGEGNLSWYSAASGGTYLGGGESFVTPTLTSTTTYYVQDSTCAASNSRTAITVSINNPAISSVTNAERCGNGQVTLKATASESTINWYTASIGGSSIANGSTFMTPSLSATTTYYVDATSGACISSNRTAVVATINSVPTITMVTDNARCGAGELTISANPSEGNINWYTALSEGSLVYTGSNYSIPSLITTTTYYAEAINGNCISNGRTAVTATIKSTPDISYTVNNKEITSNQNEGNYQWYDCDTKSTIEGETNQKYTATKTGNYAVIVEINGCSDTSACVLIQMTGSVKNTLDKEIKVYPNPCQNSLVIESMISLKGIVTVQLFALNGQEVFYQESTKEIKENIDISNLETGVYMIKILSEQGVYNQKIIKY